MEGSDHFGQWLIVFGPLSLDWDNAKRELRRGETGFLDKQIVDLKNVQRPKNKYLGAELKTAGPVIAMARLA